MRSTNLIPVILGALISLASFEALGQSDYPTSASATGTVVSMSGDELVLRTSMGEETFRLSSTVDRSGLTPGKSVTIWYDAPATSGERAVVNRISMAAGSPASAGAEGTSDPGTTTPRTTAAAELPATAGMLPLLGLIGILALAGGLVMRRRGRSVPR